MNKNLQQMLNERTKSLEEEREAFNSQIKSNFKQAENSLKAFMDENDKIMRQNIKDIKLSHERELQKFMKNITQNLRMKMLMLFAVMLLVNILSLMGMIYYLKIPEIKTINRNTIETYNLQVKDYNLNVENYKTLHPNWNEQHQEE